MIKRRKIQSTDGNGIHFCFNIAEDADAIYLTNKEIDILLSALRSQAQDNETQILVHRLISHKTVEPDLTPFPILSLPEGPIQHILSYLNSFQLLSFGGCSSSCLNFSKNEELWKSLFKRDFNEEIKAFPESITTWKRCYYEAALDYVYKKDTDQFRCVWCGKDCEENEDGNFICNACNSTFPQPDYCTCGLSYRGCKGATCKICDDRVCEADLGNSCGFCDEIMCSSCNDNCSNYCPRCGRICNNCAE